MNLSLRSQYLKEGRLSDITTLISVLALEKWTYRTEQAIEDSLNSKPISANTWFEIAKAHPEFFRTNHKGDMILLLIRFLSKEINDQGKDFYPPLTLDQTQKLIEQALVFHDKQLARSNYWIPIITLIITVLSSWLVTYFTIKSNNPTNSMDKKLDSLIIHLKIPNKN